LLQGAVVVVDLIPPLTHLAVVVAVLAVYYQVRLQLLQQFRMGLQLVLAALDHHKPTAATAQPFLKLLLAAVLGVTENLRLVKMELLAVQAVVVDTLTVRAVQEQVVKVITALQLHLQLAAAVARVLRVAYQTAARV
jgi:hypothetical protein